MSRKSREREAALIQSLVEYEAEAVAQRARADFLLRVHSERLDEQFNLPRAVSVDITPDTSAWDAAMGGLRYDVPGRWI